MPYRPEPTPIERGSDQQFRASVITSIAVHAGAGLLVLFGPMLIPRPQIMPNFVPVHIVPPAPAPAAAAPVEEEPEAAAEAVVEPEPVAPSPEEVRQEQEAEQERQRVDAERRATQARKDREAAAERERIAEENRRAEEARKAEDARKKAEADEEARRRAPQKAARRNSQPAQPQSAQRTGIDLTSAQDDTRGFTVEEFPFTHYLGRIRDLISAQWSPPPRGPYAPQRRAEVFFRIGRDGRLVVQPRMLDASGESLFDRAALQAIAQAAPFPPLPREYQGQSLGVGLAFVQE